jgi:hypothetical protein
MSFDTLITLLIIGGLGYMMFRGGGCCGSHGSHKGHHGLGGEKWLLIPFVIWKLTKAQPFRA